ncbi:MAG: DMT family transporter [Actinomycetota bacterium]|nr:DMT family transporter [Actinomycetota bacterium]
MSGRRLNENAAGLGLAIASAVAFGTTAILGKFAYREGAEPIPLLTARFAVAAVLLTAFGRLMAHVEARRGRPSVRSPHRPTRVQASRLLALGAVAFALESSLFFSALDVAPAGVVGLVFYSYPLLTSVAAMALGLEVFHRRIVAALVLGSLGILLIFTLPNEGLAGPLLALGAAAAVSVYYLFAQVLVRGVDPRAASTYTAAGAASSLLLLSAVTGQGLPAAALGPAVGLGAVTAVAFVCLYGAVARIGSARTSIACMLEPVTTLVLAAVLLDDEITWRVVAGAALVLSALPILAGLQGREPSTGVVAPDTL